MNYLQKLLKRLSKKYHGAIKNLEREYGLIDDCKFMLYLNEGYCIAGYDGARTYPVKSITECIEIVKDLVVKEQ